MPVFERNSLRRSAEEGHFTVHLVVHHLEPLVLDVFLQWLDMATYQLGARVCTADFSRLQKRTFRRLVLPYLSGATGGEGASRRFQTLVFSAGDHIRS